MADLTLDLYTTGWCPDCRIAKRVLGELGVDYREIDIEQDPQAAQLVIRENQGRRRVPTIAISDRFYGNPRPAELRSLVAAAIDAAERVRAESTDTGTTPGGVPPTPPHPASSPSVAGAESRRSK
ncbi:MAG: glutaredoxin family protein [Thermoanaerobaculia bacterium]